MNGLFLIFTAFFIFSEGVEVCQIEYRSALLITNDCQVNSTNVVWMLLLYYHQRALEPPDVHHDRLLPVSIAGLLVNLVGVFVFQHGGHGHSHGGEGRLLLIPGICT